MFNWKKKTTTFSLVPFLTRTCLVEKLSQSLQRLLTHKIRRSCRLPESFTGSGKNVPFWSHWKRKFLRRTLWHDAAIRNHYIPVGQPTVNWPNIHACANIPWPLISQRVHQCLWEKAVKVKKVVEMFPKFLEGRTNFEGREIEKYSSGICWKCVLSTLVLLWK